MKIRVGYELVYDVPQPTPMIMVLGTHFSRASDILIPDHLVTTPAVPIISETGAAASSHPKVRSSCRPTVS